MTNKTNELYLSIDKGRQEATEFLQKLLSAAQPGAVYSQPIVAGDYTVITASEVSAGGGMGTGVGVGESTQPTKDENKPVGGGGGMGGGGGSLGRPVAAITIGPSGVEIKPVLDLTKIGLAAITAWGAMLVLTGRWRKGAKL